MLNVSHSREVHIGSNNMKSTFRHCIVWPSTCLKIVMKKKEHKLSDQMEIDYYVGVKSLRKSTGTSTGANIDFDIV